ncbi:MAG: S-methyl-5'-thioinosine phosphorylase [Gammaproteobacteria bacterium]|nr:S-methyl-5'-thioinosine phosphorylase [Gammaproteobacteria bacterium]
MTDIAIIGGTGLNTINGLVITHREMVNTPYGQASSPLVYGELCGSKIVFIARHGSGHTIPPHQVNYRANLWALHNIGVKKVIAVAAVGGIRDDMRPGKVVFPDQIIDYTWSRENTFFQDNQHVKHIDFTYPYCEEVRNLLIDGAKSAQLDPVIDGTYGATQGPRLESAAEIKKLENDGCDIVGMTGMPEAALARELDICYATCAVVANWAAGKADDVITMEVIEANLKKGMEKVRLLLSKTLPCL